MPGLPILMQRLVAIATCAALVYHLLVGCCAHHMHASTDSGPRGASHASAHGCCHDHAAPAKHTDQADAETVHEQGEAAHASCENHHHNAVHESAATHTPQLALSHDAMNRDGSSPDHDDPCQSRCEGESCSYLPSAHIVFAHFCDHWIALPAVDLFALTSATNRGFSGPPRDWLDTGPPRRAHLLKCVLLV